MPIVRPLGTMVTYGFDLRSLAIDLEIAARLGVTVLEVLPDWRTSPDPRLLRQRLADQGFTLHSAHGGWGRRAIQAEAIDLAHPEFAQASLDDLKLELDWLDQAGGRHLIVHPGGLSEPTDWHDRRDRLKEGLNALADHLVGSRLIVCVENMPPGVHPGSRTADLADLLNELDRPELGLILDTGHAHISSTLPVETDASGSLLRSTHVHDNDGRKDSHLPPGLGTILWDDWLDSLDAISYRGPIMLECIRHLRENPDSIDEGLLARLACLSQGLHS